MSDLTFSMSDRPSLGVEIELAIVDAETMALKSGAQQILAEVPEALSEKIKPELMQCYIEANTDVCHTVDEAHEDLKKKIAVIEGIADPLGLDLLWSATHPFSSWRNQIVTPNSRYKGLINLLQDTARQLVTFGLHVHVGIDSGDKAIMICDRILRYLPVLLAMSCNSPFWEGRNTGIASYRSRVMDALPTAGLPPLMRNWSEYVWLVNHLVDIGYIESVRELWWDVRPHHNFGTVEIRICDIAPSLEESMAIAAICQCLVKALDDDITQGAYQHDCHPFMIRENKWQAARYGLDAQLVDSTTYELHPARKMLTRLVERLGDVGQDLGCAHWLDRAAAMAQEPTGANRQIERFNRTHDLQEVVRETIAG